MAELDLRAPQRRRRQGCPQGVRQGRKAGVRLEARVTIDYNARIPNNVDLAGDRALQRALEQWQPDFVDWWREMGPEGSSGHDVYLRTATGIDTEDWTRFGYVKMPEYRWGIFLAPAVED